MLMIRALFLLEKIVLRYTHKITAHNRKINKFIDPLKMYKKSSLIHKHLSQ